MSRLTTHTPDQAPTASQPLLAAVKQKLGVVPNLMRVLAGSPSTLNGYLGLSGAIGEGSLTAADRERIAIAVAEANGCEYCLSAHFYLGKHVARIDDAELVAARDAHSSEPRAAALLGFAKAVLEQRGRVSDEALKRFLDAGFSEAAALEVVANVALNVLTNYTNNLAGTEVDFPAVPARKAA